jgi:RNA polymerase sigma-70 factor, ECF subfamily
MPLVMYVGLLDRPLNDARAATDLTETVADDWVTRIRQGDAGAFDALYLAFYPLLCAFVATIVGNAEQSEDIVQDLLCRIWEQRTSWRPTTGGARRYLFGAARNRALNHLKRRQIEARAADAVPVVDGVPTPASYAETADFNAALARALAELPPRCRQACVLRWRYGLAYSEIADAMSVTQKAVEALLTRGIKSLRIALIAFDM